MTEAEWLTCAEPWPMLVLLAPTRSERKLRMVAGRCCRRVRDVIPSREAGRCVEVAERYADGRAGRGELDAAVADSVRACEQLPRPLAPGVADAINAVSRVHRAAAASRGPAHGLAASAWATAEAWRTRPPGEPEDAFAARRDGLLAAEFARQCDLFREIFGNPLRPVAFAPAWRTDTAVALARGMYEAHDFAAMPILADALQDAGCVSADVLTHCRDARQVHVCGCWVVDLVLGKE